MRLELRGLTKRFGTLLANDHIDLVVEPGEIHCLLGENGAGKSTLMNTLYGLLQPDEGQILLDGRAWRCESPRAAIAAGIGMVHQHFMLVPVFTVAENIMLGRERVTRFGLLDRAAAQRRVVELSERYGLAVQADALVTDLSVGEQQRVEILKALANDVEVLILDEPTAVLTPQEIDELIEVLRAIAATGTSIIFISHKLKEVTRLADRITVIRRGAVVATVDPDTPERELAELMVGRSVELVVGKSAARPSGPTLVVDGLTVVDAAGAAVVDDVSFRVAGGEIVGIAGVVGNGQSELINALLGLATPVRGSITVRGTELTGRSPRAHLDAGIGYVPEDRSHDGFIGTFSVAENLVLDLTDRRSSPVAACCRAMPCGATRPSGSRSSIFALAQRPTRSVRSRAATSRRWCWHGRCRVRWRCSSPVSPPSDWMSGRSSSCTIALSANVIGVPRC